VFAVMRSGTTLRQEGRQRHAASIFFSLFHLI
jgi:hypothetical protein